MTTSVVDCTCPEEPAAIPAPLRLGLLGLGTVGGAVARLTRAEAPAFHARGLVPVVVAALVRDPARRRPASALSALVTADADAFFSAAIDVVVEALGGVEPARTLVTRALDAGVPVVTANKSLVAAHGEELFALARRRGTALRYEASCIAGVPFLGTFERRPLASRVRGVTGILNGTSNAIASALARGVSYDAALADAQRQGFAEPDPSADVSGADASQKLAILVRLFAHRTIAAPQVPSTPLHVLDAADLAAASAFGGHLKPIAFASWTPDRSPDVAAFVAPAFVDEGHPLARVSHVTNGVVVDAAGGEQCFIGPGAGPDVTAATLLDDVVELATERTLRTPAPVTAPVARVMHPASRWFVRVPGEAPDSEIADLLGSFGVWCERLSGVGGRRYALTFSSSHERAVAALSALAAAGAAGALILPAFGKGAAC